MLEAATKAKVTLTDGRLVEFEIRPSAKTRSLRLKISARAGLVVTAPVGLEPARVMKLVADKADWIAGRLTEFDAVRDLVHQTAPARPQAFDLPALAESWRVEYKATRALTVGARTDRPGRILVSGAIDDAEACRAALRRWLARHAKTALSPWLSSLAQQHGLDYMDLAIKNQRTRTEGRFRKPDRLAAAKKAPGEWLQPLCRCRSAPLRRPVGIPGIHPADVAARHRALDSPSHGRSPSVGCKFHRR